MTDLSLIEIRSYDVLEDRNFIYSTWLKGLRYKNPFLKSVKEDKNSNDPLFKYYSSLFSQGFYKHYQPILEELFKSPQLKVNLACLKEDPHVILGYCVYTENTLHWMFVKNAWRKLGIAKLIWPEGINSYSDISLLGMKIMNQKNLSLTFKPLVGGKNEHR